MSAAYSMETKAEVTTSELSNSSSPKKMEGVKNEGSIKARSNTMGPQTLALNTHKAGMEGLDAEKINEIIKKASEGSKFYQHKQKCQQRLDAKISEMMKAKASFSEEQIRKAILQMDHLIDELELERDLTHTIVHVDMDMFYAAVEMRDEPSLKDKPMAVGSTGMLSTSNYAARKFGVRAAMPGFIGKKLCPELIIVPPNFTKYKECSKVVQSVFAEYDPNFCPMSLDEAYLDITDFIQKNSSKYTEDVDDDVNDGNVVQRIVNEMREKIHAKTQLTASAGIASNTRLAKVCSDMNKPNGQFYLPPDRQKILDFISSLPIRKVSGIGNVSEQQLSALGIKVCSDLMEKRGLLRLLFTDLNYNYFMSIALGLGSTSIEGWTDRDRKSISTETTFRGTADKEFLFKQTEDLCQELADEMVEKDIFGRVLTLKIKMTNFKLKTKAHSFLEATRSYESLMSAARKLMQHEMDACAQPLSLRLIGVRMSSLVTSSEVGPSRQVTLTHMFSKASHSKSKEVNKQSSKVDDSSASPRVENALTNKSQKEYDVSERSVEKNMHAESCAATKEGKCIVIDNKDQVRNTVSKSSSSNSFFSKFGNKANVAKNIKYECPICYTQIQTTSITKFNIHVDECLNSTNTAKSSKTSKATGDRVIQDFLIKDHVEGKINEHQMDEKGRGNGSQTGNNKKTQELRSRKDLSESNSYTSIVKEDKLLCPVCKQAVFKNLNLLNIHIDECLNMGTISKICGGNESQVAASSHCHQKATVTNVPGALKDEGQDISRPKKKQKTCHNTLEKYFTS